MAKPHLSTGRTVIALLGIAALSAGCAAKSTPATSQPTATATAANLPAIGSVTLDQTAVPRYESLEMTVAPVRTAIS